jgi:hypothetical protein
MGTWQGWPCSRLLGSLRRHVVAPNPFPGEREVRAPEASPDGQAHRGRAPTCGGAGPRRGVRACGGQTRAPCPCGYVEAPDL